MLNKGVTECLACAHRDIEALYVHALCIAFIHGHHMGHAIARVDHDAGEQTLASRSRTLAPQRLL